jgi:hypothetical protein
LQSNTTSAAHRGEQAPSLTDLMENLVQNVIEFLQENPFSIFCPDLDADWSDIDDTGFVGMQ